MKAVSDNPGIASGLSRMILIAAALNEELRVGLDLCRHTSRLGIRGIGAWTCVRGERQFTFLKTGVGPRRAAKSLDRFLSRQTPSRIVSIGYAGALDPALAVGDLVMSQRALLLEEPSKDNGVSVAESWDLESVLEDCTHEGLDRPFLIQGMSLTSSRILGDPEHKKLLHEKLGALIVDMETAALARVAAQSHVPLSCVRAVSDTADDDFLKPFSREPAAGPASRVVKLVSSGSWLRGYSQWRKRAAGARDSLRRFLLWYLEACPD